MNRPHIPVHRSAYATAALVMTAFITILLGPCACAATSPRQEELLHVPSPDWRDQVIYFAMIDRFDDGDPSNNDQGAGEYDPSDPARYSGGDLAGLTRRLDYIRGLGATALWITPPVAHQWWNSATKYGGYHGYWAEDFERVDAHFGTAEDYRTLSRALHARGMYLVQDVVVNHTANYFGYVGEWDPADPALNFVLHPTHDGRTAPSRAPFSLNDARDPRHRAAGIYHWTPDISDFRDRTQELQYQLAGLDDLNTENPRVRDALRATYAHWIRSTGVDAFRVDTAFHVQPDFFEDFLRSPDREHPGILHVAADTGRHGFHVFGEGFGVDRAFDDTQARKLDGYMRQPDGRPLLPGMINFPLYGTLIDVFARGRPTAELAHRIDSTMAIHAEPHLMPTFVDNHDVDRFLASGNEAGLRQALLAIMALPGIPTIYYGTEQGYTAQRAAMFAGGVGSEGRDHFDASAPLYRYLQRAIGLRRGHRVLSRGVPTVLASNTSAPGAVAWRMDHGKQRALVVLNTSDRPALLDNLATGLAPGTALQPVFAIEGEAPRRTVGAESRLHLVLPPRAGFVWIADVRSGAGHASAGDRDSAPGYRAAAEGGTLEGIVLDTPPNRAGGDFQLRGRGPAGRELRLVVDGDIAAALTVVPDKAGRWSAGVDTGAMIDPAAEHALVLWDPARGAASRRHVFRVERDWTLSDDVRDPQGDDTGPSNRYAYPTDAGWRARRQADLLGARAWRSGGSLRLELRMRDVTATWNPANGFDHVAFTVFVELPRREVGATVMPLQNAVLPDGMHWHYRLRTHGWSSALFSADGASSTREGTPVPVSAHVSADAENDTVTLTLPAQSLGNTGSLRGARVYVTTWDYDGGYRPLLPQAGPQAFGGGSEADPRIMDALLLRLR